MLGIFCKFKVSFMMLFVMVLPSLNTNYSFKHEITQAENLLVNKKNRSSRQNVFGGVHSTHLRYVTSVTNQRMLSETFCGTMIYAPPEILKGQPYSPKIADMWSFGVLVFTMLNKANPFSERNRRGLLKLQESKKWSFRPRYEKVLSKEVKLLVTNLLEPNIQKRFTIDEVLKSDWISMDPKLRVMSAEEFTAYTAAVDELNAIKTSSAQGDVARKPPSRIRTKSIDRNVSAAFLKQIDTQLAFLNRSKRIQSF